MRRDEMEYCRIWELSSKLNGYSDTSTRANKNKNGGLMDRSQRETDWKEVQDDK